MHRDDYMQIAKSVICGGLCGAVYSVACEAAVFLNVGLTRINEGTFLRETVENQPYVTTTLSNIVLLLTVGTATGALTLGVECYRDIRKNGRSHFSSPSAG